MGADVHHARRIWLLEGLMRPHGRARIDSRHPQALGVCQRCGFMYNLVNLKWQYDWQFSARLHNIGIQVCPDCLDKPQPSGKPVVLPIDPVPVEYALPENYAAADNPLSPLGYDVGNMFLPAPPQSLGGNIGNMILNAGVNAAFDGVTNKRAQNSAALAISNSSYQNTVGKNWNAYPSGIALTMPSTVAATTHIVSSFALYAPNDQAFLNSATGITGFTLDGSSDSVTWTTLYSGTTTGAVGETVTATSTSVTSYGYHRIVFQGDGLSAVAVAQVELNVSDAAPNDI
jgi:hypothetical protein